MIEIIKQEWEITKTYIFDVVLRDGPIKLGWKDFEKRARKYVPFMAVKADASAPLSELVESVLEAIHKNDNKGVSCIMMVISYKKDNEIMIDEMGGLYECFSRLADNDVDIVWGIQQADDIENNRCVTVFAFQR
jgi:hypothetical protein